MSRLAILRPAGFLASALAMSACGWTVLAPLAAQEVVQAMPLRESAQLNAALRKLASRPADLEALLSAGNASLALSDASAAAGFFARASRVAPGDRRVVLGTARVALAQRRPVEALQGFAQAESAGVRPLEIAADRGLAYDLVGDNASAQLLYRSVLAVGDSAEVRRRLALSLAISGNRSEFERVLFPLLRGEDRSAFRTRAFGLAILGLPDDAVEIADAMMPTDLALRMAPYLRYMPRLTKSQQAAAGHLGAFPAATEIGRDPPDVAGYAGAGARIAANANAALTPTGAPLGRRAEAKATPAATSARRRPGRNDDVASSAPAQAPVRLTRASEAPPPAAQPPQASGTNAAPAVVVASEPLVMPAVAPAGLNAPAPAPTPAPAPLRPSISDAFADLAAAPVSPAGPAVGAVDIAKLPAVRKAAAPPVPKPAAKEPVAKSQPEAKKPEAKKPEAKKPEAKKPEPKKPAEPARVWVQVGVGRNTGAFAFDWKKLAKQAGGALDGKGPWAVKYGATNRMLAGPYPTDAAARAAIKRLKDKEIDALPYSSGEGERVTKIG